MRWSYTSHARLTLLHLRGVKPGSFLKRISFPYFLHPDGDVIHKFKYCRHFLWNATVFRRELYTPLQCRVIHTYALLHKYSISNWAFQTVVWDVVLTVRLEIVIRRWEYNWRPEGLKVCRLRNAYYVNRRVSTYIRSYTFGPGVRCLWEWVRNYALEVNNELGLMNR